MLHEISLLFQNEPIAMTGALICGIGIILLAGASISYRFRAFTNKKAWDGKTLPLLKIGLFLFIIGAAIFLYAIYIL
ncbi:MULTISPECIES: hypothetical protein [unclassified Breznakia]|uniref:hypothetical protein n=1 Tax=unclassified Breznakia TaxID=2623764 RepID=UPI0024771534|nr:MULTISPECIES: hypothetical protein [unclassified Breznakia]MDH6366220.1 hypothetical protein [Breznakia sp. PH1-1]MDH6403313.1 hypothetical protein [Breznakia sp. PF1-11]MDH6411022.1 hypothetical protein [Breznakia sp. PFB1-11]MDH6413386.1 hypothetical protein [Breznakia sp. PFB1-14]MDH6416151.1 hypothetical protein [Breznakia sp. PFB1-4]